MFSWQHILRFWDERLHQKKKEPTGGAFTKGSVFDLTPMEGEKEYTRIDT